MDKTSKKVIKFMKKLENHQYPSKNATPPIPEPEFTNCIRYLEEGGYVYTDKIGNSIIFATLTHKGLHSKEIRREEIFREFVRSIFCPIVVAFATELLIHGIPYIPKIFSLLLH